MEPQDMTDRYFAAVRARDIEGLTALYAEDASVTLPDGREYAGKAAIRAMHEGVFAAGAPLPTPLATVIGVRSAAVEIEARLPDGTIRHTANIYHLGDGGLIQRVGIYRRV